MILNFAISFKKDFKEKFNETRMIYREKHDEL